MAKSKKPNAKQDPTVKVAVITAIAGIATVLIASLIAPIVLKSLDSTPTSHQVDAVNTPTITPLPLTTETPVTMATPFLAVVHDFSESPEKWPLGTEVVDGIYTRTATVENGIYRVTINASDAVAVIVKPNVPKVSDFELTMTISQIDGPTKINFGPTFGMSGPEGQGYFSFLINSNGEYLLDVYRAPYVTLQRSTPSDAINIGSDNTFRIVTKEGEIALYINDEFVGQYNEDSTQGLVGFQARVLKGQSATFEIKDFQLVLNESP